MLFYGGTEGRDFSSTMCLFEVVEEKKKSTCTQLLYLGKYIVFLFYFYSTTFQRDLYFLLHIYLTAGVTRCCLD